VCHLLIAEFQHRRLDILLCAHEFLAHAHPVALVAVFQQAFAPLGEALPDSECTGLADQSLADILQVLRTLGEG